MLPVFPRAASAGPGLHPPVADWRVSGRLPDAVPALEALFVRAVHQGLQKLRGNQPVTGTTSRRWRAGVRSLISTQAARVRTASARRRLEGVWKSARSYARATSSPLPTPSSAASVPRRPRSAEPTAAPAPRAQERSLCQDRLLCPIASPPPRCPVCVHNTTKILLNTSRAAANTTPVLGLYLPVQLLHDPDRLRARWSRVAHGLARREGRRRLV